MTTDVIGDSVAFLITILSNILVYMFVSSPVCRALELCSLHLHEIARRLDISLVGKIVF